MRGFGGCIYGREGMGKTSLGLYFPGPVWCKSVGESGYETLEIAGDVPENTMNSVISSYEQLVAEIRNTKTGTILIDALRGVQQLIMDSVCKEEFQNNWKLFNDYSQGLRRNCVNRLQVFLDVCSQKVREGVNIVFVSHAITTPMPNTMGADFLCHVINLDDSDKGAGMRSIFTAWCEFIFFLNLGVDITIATETNKQKIATEGKASQIANRLIYTSLATGHQAKNRWKMPPIIPMGEDAKTAFENLWNYFPPAYKKGQ